MESSGAAVPTVSPARPGRKTADGDHCGNRARAGGLHLDDRQTGTTRDPLKSRDWDRKRPGGTHHATTHPIPGKAGGTSRPGEPSKVLSAGSYPTLETRPRKLRDVSPVRR